MRAPSIVAATLASAFLAGCAQGNPTTVPMPNANGSAARSAPFNGHAVVSIRIPHRDKHARYVSPSTKSLVISANGKAIAKLNVTPASPGCSAANGSTTCTLRIGTPTGKVTFLVQAYGGTSGTGHVLSSGTVVAQISAGKLSTIPLTLTGIVASVAVFLGTPNPAAGTPASTSATVTAYDASGAAIVGPGNYNVPVTLTDSDATGITSLTGSTILGPGGTSTLAYSGASLASATIGATVACTPACPVTAATFAPAPGVVASYPVPASIADDEPYAIAVGPDGNLWYTTDGGTTEAIVKMTTSGAMTVYEGGVAIPTNDRYLGIAAGPDGALWFTERNSKQIGRIDVNGNVTETAATGSAGTACPNQIAAGPASDGAMWFTSLCGGLIGRIMPGTPPVVQTFALGAGTAFEDILLGKDSNLYVVDRSNHAIGQAVISAATIGAYSEVPIGPSPLVTANNTAMLALAQTGDGTLWWTNQACSPSTIGSLPIAAPFTASTPQQYLTLQGCTSPAFLAVAPAGSLTLWAAEYAMPTLEQIAAPAGGGTPVLTDTSLPTAPGTSQGIWDIVLGPDGNLWATNRTAGGSIFKLAY